MKTYSSILACTAFLVLVGCGGDSASDPQANSAKPALKEPIPEGPKSGIGLASSTDAPAGVSKGAKKK